MVKHPVHRGVELRQTARRSTTGRVGFCTGEQRRRRRVAVSRVPRRGRM